MNENAFLLNQLTIQYLGSATPTIENLSLSIRKGHWTCLLGKSGCGKSTILRYLANLLPIETQISGGLPQVQQQYLQHNIAYMGQEDLLMPWLSALENVCLHKKFMGKTTTQDRQNAVQLLAELGLEEKIHVYPRELSGGMRQRVALARTLIQDKPVILMDEPFSALDAVTRHQLQSLAFERLRHKTVLMVTHDPAEATRLAHEIFIFQPNQLATTKINLTTPPPRAISENTAKVQEDIYRHLESIHE